ncbi:uncharacterized protein LOC110944788 [Helianthus annuus]|uniref:uncharacterized protein LOC110944788 n=1 Tax=Helianthus annuus TaxID=4232 RepID=UPI000B8F8DD9|nr:uncharacterized protein LOC110944788 [Helianthus annuus]
MRQGDPLSPFLFLLVMEALSACFKKAIEIGAVEGIRFPNDGPLLSHLLFADDALVVGEWNRKSILNVVRIPHCFHLCSGLKINLSKSSIIGIGVDGSEVDSMALAFGCKAEKLPFKYLGLPVGANMNRISNWRAIVSLPGDSGVFSVNSAYELLVAKEVPPSSFSWEWCKWIPIKCNVFAWRATLERLPTKVELCKRNVQVEGLGCPMCEEGDEMAAHLFTACSFAMSIWTKISSWCKVPFLMAFSFKDKMFWVLISIAD